jgi:hypothetical protein
MSEGLGSAPGQSGIIVRPRIFPLAFLLLFTKPRLSIDGALEQKASWGECWFPLPPGRHSVRCYVPYLWYRHMGDSTIEVDVPQTGSVKIQWMSPWLVFIAGKWKQVTSPG